MPYGKSLSVIIYHLSFRPQAAGRTTGGLAQLARALAWHARGHRFESDILHERNEGCRMQNEESFWSESSFEHRSLTY